METPRVSVIVPIYNYAQFLPDCVQSVANQTVDYWELILVDDCSTDNSLEVAHALREKHGSRITVMRTERNQGYSHAKNEGIVRSKGEFITCLDADDMFTKESLESRVDAFDQSRDLQMVHARAFEFKGDSDLTYCYHRHKTGEPKTFKWNTRVRVHAQTVMLRRRVHQEFGLYDESLRSRSDKEMWWRLLGKDCRSPKIKVTRIDVAVAYYRKHNRSMMKYRRKNPKYDAKVTALLEKAWRIRKKGINRGNTRFLDR